MPTTNGNLATKVPLRSSHASDNCSTHKSNRTLNTPTNRVRSGISIDPSLRILSLSQTDYCWSNQSQRRSTSLSRLATGSPTRRAPDRLGSRSRITPPTVIIPCASRPSRHLPYSGYSYSLLKSSLHQVMSINTRLPSHHPCAV
jgi:hypothetical protein